MTTQLMKELDQTINLLEAQIPANPRSPKNEGFAKRLQRSLARYFRQLEDAFPYAQIDRLYLKYVREQLGSETREMLDTMLATFDEELTLQLNGHLTTIYSSGSAEMITWGKTKAGVPIAYEGPPIQQAIDWASSHIAKVKLVDGINAETKKQISNIIADGIKNKRGIPGITSDIRHKFNWMARGAPSEIRPGLTLRSRAEMIARTETSNALSQASLDALEDIEEKGLGDVDKEGEAPRYGKEWITVGDDRVSDECEANENQGVIPTNQAFTSGPMAPPQHPDCRCAIGPVRLKSKPKTRAEKPKVGEEPEETEP